ncbi:transcriptional regulator of AraC family [alpha proteobacterium U9-1i]|nr:transcriptional regulator of AraC family [alpha proteobacterium U9-1i]
MSEATVSAGYASDLLDLALVKGARRADLLACAGIDDVDLADPDNRVPFESFKRLMRAAKEKCGEPALALHFGARNWFLEGSVVGLITRASATMGEAFAQMNRYARLVVEVDGHESGPRFSIAPRDGGVWLEDHRRNPNDFPELTESTWARFVCNYANAFPDRPHYVKAVHMTHAAPAHRVAYDQFFKMPMTFESDRNALLIDPNFVREPTNQGNRYVFGIFSERAQALLDSLEQAKTTRGAVESLLIPILHTGDVSMDDVAGKMGVSRPTLYRKLKAEGVAYEDVLDDLRRRMSLHYLDGKKVSVNQTAYLVGFSDPSAFSRAFKRWTGVSPAQRRGA